MAKKLYAILAASMLHSATGHAAAAGSRDHHHPASAPVAAIAGAGAAAIDPRRSTAPVARRIGGSVIPTAKVPEGASAELQRAVQCIAREKKIPQKAVWDKVIAANMVTASAKTASALEDLLWALMER